MTGISPLQNFHKKGLFGDHHKKNESDLLQISEVKNLNIIQVVRYKKSKFQLRELDIDGIKFPEVSSTANSNENTRILWNGPNNWLILSFKENIFNIIEKKCRVENFAVTDVSHSRAIIQLKGFQAKEILKKGSPINLNNFKKNNCSGTIFQGINIIIDKLDDNPETFNIFALRSFGESIYYDITDAALENGYIGV